MTSLKSNSKALKQISRSGPPNDWLHTALTLHSFKLVVFCSLSSLHPEDESISSPVGKQTVEWEEWWCVSPRLCKGGTLWSLQWLVCKCLSLHARGPKREVGVGTALAPGNWRFSCVKQYMKWFLLSISSLLYFSTALASNLDSFVLFVKEFSNI